MILSPLADGDVNMRMILLSFFNVCLSSSGDLLMLERWSMSRMK